MSADAAVPKDGSRKHNQVFRMEAVWYPTVNPEEDLLLKHGGDAKKWAEELDGKLNKYLFKPHCKLWVWQLEKGEKEGKYHCQIYFELYKKTRTLTLASQVGNKEMLSGISMREASLAGRAAIRFYCAKDETRVAGPFSNQALGQTEVPTAWDMKAIKDSPFPWQKSIITWVSKKCNNDRKIVWIYDPAGCSGKTKLIKYCLQEKLAIPIQYGAARDLMNMIYQNKGANAYMFDLTRCKPKQMPGDDIYSTMEAAKNGMVQNTKYETGFATFDPPHMFIFANVKPEFSKLTRDRWQVLCINEDGKLQNWYKEGDTPKGQASWLVDDGSYEMEEEEKEVKEEKKPIEDNMAMSPLQLPRPALSVQFRTATEVLKEQLSALRSVRWDAYWRAVQKRWEKILGRDKCSKIRGVGCMHNPFGCDACHTERTLEEEMDPPSGWLDNPLSDDDE